MNWLILLQALLYFCIFILGFLVCIPVGINRSSFDGECILYADVHHSGKIYITGSASSNCEFPIYFSVFGMIIVGLLAGLCFGYFALRSRSDEDVGRRMWTLPFIPLNAVLTIIALVTACVLSHGFNIFCESVKDLSDLIKSCALLEHQTFNNKTDTGGFVGLSSLSQAGAWIGFFIYLIQTGISVLRFFRNRQLKQKSTGSS
ncbi:transmembrane protein 179B-like [Mercenaria mercenaria]|uniref:transmembrane protein 179B-like n=1 Tax=Mercenaria mercenaria TaxID=6596 RepID=UPI001E1D6128|nr:transmembrane protein 179B-like [Mercenaria mercenaria]XP_045187113.1 transmembrane protein 179B-like [Mercenaria mercenaria]XP_053395765.1 transmembrane protein 179B-like [Mercenaria mercenaria]